MTSLQPLSQRTSSPQPVEWPFRRWFTRKWWGDRIAELKYGFAEHGWTGKLFLLECGLSVAWTAVIISLQIIRAIVIWTPEFSVVGVSLGIGFLLPLLLVQGRYILGIARFEKWAGLLAPALSFLGALTSIGMLTRLHTFGLRGTILFGAQFALCVQYFVYFIRNRDRFETRRHRLPRPSEVR